MTRIKTVAAKVAGTAAVLSMLLVGGAAYAQTTTTTGASTTPTTPNTGAGGDAAQNIALLSLSGLVALAGGVYLSYKSRAAMQ